jgi:hypothetical protein
MLVPWYGDICPWAVNFIYVRCSVFCYEGSEKLFHKPCNSSQNVSWTLVCGVKVNIRRTIIGTGDTIFKEVGRRNVPCLRSLTSFVCWGFTLTVEHETSLTLHYSIYLEMVMFLFQILDVSLDERRENILSVLTNNRNRWVENLCLLKKTPSCY